MSSGVIVTFERCFEVLKWLTCCKGLDVGIDTQLTTRYVQRWEQLLPL